MKRAYEKAIRKIEPETRMLIRALESKHYRVAGFLQAGQVVEVDRPLGEMLIAMHEDLVEEKEEEKEKKVKEPEEKLEPEEPGDGTA